VNLHLLHWHPLFSATMQVVVILHAVLFLLLKPMTLASMQSEGVPGTVLPIEGLFIALEVCDVVINFLVWHRWRLLNELERSDKRCFEPQPDAADGGAAGPPRRIHLRLLPARRRRHRWAIANRDPSPVEGASSTWKPLCACWRRLHAIKCCCRASRWIWSGPSIERAWLCAH